MSLADGVAQWLDGLGLVSYIDVDGGDCFLGAMPAKPDVALVVTDTPGGRPLVANDVDFPALQLRARGAAYDYRGPVQWLADIYAVLHDLRGTTLPNGMHVKACDATQSNPTPLGQDDANRFEFIHNYACQTRRA